MAIQAASSNSVLLIDADRRHRRVARRFHVNGTAGWHEILSGSAAVQSCIQPSKLNNLAVLAPGGAQNGASAARKVENSVGQLDDLKTQYGLIVVDLPRARELEGPPTSNWIDEVVLVVEAERTRIQTAQRARDTLQRRGVHIAGVVLANRREHIPRWLYQRL
jgi:Mrp family chromosome partitioning ATPase